MLSLSELLRVLQFFNTGGIRCSAAEPFTEDGYDATSEDGSFNCPPHDADYAEQDWTLSLPEVLRVIQIFNAGGYERCEEGEDGFCVLVPAVG